jgi:hypothetical protein
MQSFAAPAASIAVGGYRGKLCDTRFLISANYQILRRLDDTCSERPENLLVTLAGKRRNWRNPARGADIHPLMQKMSDATLKVVIGAKAGFVIRLLWRQDITNGGGRQ